MLMSWLLHETGHELDADGEILPCVDEVAEASDKPPVLCCVHFCRCALVAELEPFLHQGVNGIAVSHPRHL